MAFRFFELLLRADDADALQSEIGFFRSLDNIIKHAGYSPHVFEDWVEETIGLLEKCIDWLPRQDGVAALVEAFNDSNIESSIVQHFRVSSPAYMSALRSNRNLRLSARHG